MVEEAARSSILPACDEGGELSCVGLANVNQINILTCMYVASCFYSFSRVTFLLFFFFPPPTSFLFLHRSCMHLLYLPYMRNGCTCFIHCSFRPSLKLFELSFAWRQDREDLFISCLHTLVQLPVLLHACSFPMRLDTFLAPHARAGLIT